MLICRFRLLNTTGLLAGKSNIHHQFLPSMPSTLTSLQAQTAELVGDKDNELNNLPDCPLTPIDHATLEELHEDRCAVIEEAYKEVKVENMKLSAALAKGQVVDIIIFVDRDMFMRFLGGGIGHRAFLHVRGPGTESNGREDVEDPSNYIQEVVLIAISKEHDAQEDNKELERAEGGKEGEEGEEDYSYQSEELDDGAGVNKPVDVEEEDFGPEDGEDDVGDGGC
ncbi:hypothetical protein EW026_g6285 [Hermanssonia centrifuga]|uniref:Uncharacterized protein n=1 Tax=Hermanssonia centrifuga TaxID=98765 RepID=A0A4S4KBH0_9APHY|nr:hypothetical protein EW026_g6285 [Hermanssonia centrifuga]